MLNKILIGFAIIIIGICIIFSIGKRNRNSELKEQISPTWKESNSLQLMVTMENEMARESESSLHSTDEAPEYSNLYPYLYTVSNKPQKMDRKKKVAYLTFDDGPSENTQKILDILEEKGVKATFFVVGSSIKEEDDEECLKRMVKDGHIIGIHSFSHLCNEIYCSIERFLDDFNIVYQLIYDITDKKVNIYRFPWGSNNSYSRKIKKALVEEMERRGFTFYDWNVSADDSFGNPTSQSIKKSILKDLEVNDHPIVLMHDAASNDLTAKTLPQVIDMIREKGYEFDTLDHREPYQFK